MPPIIVNNSNFAKGAPGEPTLLSFDDAETLFHEFGHACTACSRSHAIRARPAPASAATSSSSRRRSRALAGGAGDAQRHVRHPVETGAPIPDELLTGCSRAPLRPGLRHAAYTARPCVDMEIHSRQPDKPVDVVAFERAELERLGIPAEVGVNASPAPLPAPLLGRLCRRVLFLPVGGSARRRRLRCLRRGRQPFDAEVARRLARFIYSSGNSIEPGEAYRAFRGRAAGPEPMLRQRGLSEPVPS